MKQFEFREAKPVWAKEKEREMNFSLIMRAVVARGEKTLLDITGHSDYQICINGCFFAHGPARAGH